MALGVDTCSTLSSINWSSLYSYMGRYPSFAGRYFSGQCSWVSGEAANVKTNTGGVLSKVFPIQYANLSGQSVSGSTGYNNGKNDATALCNEIISVVVTGQLNWPSGSTIYVYLDVEAPPNNVVTVDYWAGWSNIVNSWIYNTLHVFRACVYAYYQLSGSNYSLDPHVATVLNSSCASYPSDNTVCHGLWPSEPEPCSACAPNPSPTWPSFNAFTQTYCSGNNSVPVMLWQFAERPSCVSGCGYSNFANGQNVDLDSDNSGATGAENYMLLIP